MNRENKKTLMSVDSLRASIHSPANRKQKAHGFLSAYFYFKSQFKFCQHSFFKFLSQNGDEKNATKDKKKIQIEL